MKTPSERRVALITGASSGLGAGMAREFASRGYDVAICARRVDALEALQAEIVAAHPDARVEVAPLDVTEFERVGQVVRGFHDTFGHIDTVVVNAGIGTGAAIGKGGMQKNLRLLDTNVNAALAQAEAAMEIFREAEKGHLVFVSSMSAMRGMRGSMTAYAASKAAVATLAEGLRADVMRKRGIDVTTLYPGYIDTELNAHLPRSSKPFLISAEKGCRLLVNAIERRVPEATVPSWPWGPVGWFMRNAPLSWVSRLT